MSTNTFALSDPQTHQMAFEISSFGTGDDFSSVRRNGYFSMFLVKNGAGSLTRDATTYSFKPGCLVCFSLYQPFAIYPDAEFEGELINFHPAFFCLFKHRAEVSCNGVLFNNLYDTPVLDLTNDELKSLQAITRLIRNEMERKQPDHDVVLSYLKIFLIESSRAKIDQRQNENTRNPSVVVTELQQAIETHFKTLRVPADYSEYLHIPVKTLNKACRQFFSKTLTTLIAERMTIEAKRELYLTAKSIKQIAYELGYSDEFYFSRFFKKNAGVSPKIFRDTVGFDKAN